MDSNNSIEITDSVIENKEIANASIESPQDITTCNKREVVGNKINDAIDQNKGVTTHAETNDYINTIIAKDDKEEICSPKELQDQHKPNDPGNLIKPNDPGNPIIPNDPGNPIIPNDSGNPIKPNDPKEDSSNPYGYIDLGFTSEIFKIEITNLPTQLGIGVIILLIITNYAPLHI